MLHNGWQ